MQTDATPSHATAEPSPWAWRLGYGGLLPFAAGALLVWLVRADTQPYVASGLAAYGALIVSFLGGIHWGLAMRQPLPAARLLLWGVVPSLLAWPAVMMPPHAGLVVLGLLLLLNYAVDRVLYAEQQVAGWLTLRFRLSSVAALCCFVGAAGS
jgi:Protein of unknown function (DUF3429)